MPGFIFGLFILILIAGCGSENPFTRGPELASDNTSRPTGERISFSADVVPALSVCASCHSSGAGGWTYNGGNGSYASVVGIINQNTPEESELLVLATGGNGHGGGRLFSAGSAEYQTILAWIQQGAGNN